jgi:hypothetical protein
MQTIRLAVSCLVCLAIPLSAQEQKPSPPETLPTIASKVDTLQKIDGYMPLYWQSSTGKLFMEIGRFNTELLYQVSLPAGLGSNPVGLDRGQLGDSSVVTFERIGPKVLMTQPNYSYRAITSDEAERRAVRDSFAQSVLWGFKVKAAARSSTPHRSSCATPTASSNGCVRRSKAPTSSTRAAARSTCRARKVFRRTPRSRRR